MANEDIGDHLSCSNQEKEKNINNKRELKKQQLQERNQQKLMEKIKKDTERKQKEEEKKRKEIERKKKEFEKEEDRKRREAEKKQKDEEKRKKEEEKKIKEEERRLKEIEKEEEKRKKEEERKRKDEEKRKEEEEKDKQLQKQRAILLGFFNKEKNDQESSDYVSCGLKNIGSFKPIEIKKDMKISPIERIEKKLINSLKDLLVNSETYLEELSANKTGSGKCEKTWPMSEPEIQLATSTRLKSKTLSFVENIRPPYYGTWRKHSQIITPLTPLAEDPGFFDYELDSDQEWEYESGEDIASSDNEEDEEIKEEPEDISFMVPHGYLSDGEDSIDLDPDEEQIPTLNATNKRPLTNETRQIMIEIKDKQFQAERKQYVHQINPIVTGPCFVSNIDPNSPNSTAGGNAYRMICRTGEGFPVICNLLSDYDNPTNHTKIKSVPPEAVPQIIRLVHCNQMSRVKLCYEFRMFWEYNLSKKLPDVTFENDLQGKDWDEFSIGKKRFFEKLKEIADRKDGMWVVKPEVIQEYQLCCINDDPEKPCAEKWKYVSDVVNIDTKKLPKNPKKRKAENKHVNEKLLKCESDDTKPLLEKSK